MLRWLFDYFYVRKMARTIHDMCCYPMNLHRRLGIPISKGFENHPFLHHSDIRDPSVFPSIFYLSFGPHQFRVMVQEKTPELGAWLSISPDGEFRGASVTMSDSGRFTVDVNDRLPDLGPLRKKLARHFARRYGALDWNNP
jgi:hypothetical protein